MMASGFAAITARCTASASKASATTACAPSDSIIAILDCDRVVPVAAWPASRNSLSSGRPITPLAPETKTFIVEIPFRSRHRGVHLGRVVIFEILDRLAIGEAPGVGLLRPDHLAGLLVAPGAAAEHDNAVALGDEMLGGKFDHAPVTLESREILLQCIAAAVFGQVPRALRRALRERTEGDVVVADL